METRFQQILDSLGIKQTVLARELNVSEGTIRGLLSGRVKTITGDILIELQERYKINPLWLVKGQGEMFMPEPTTMESATLPMSSLKGDDFDLLKEIIATLIDLFEENDLTLPGTRFAELVMLLFEDLKKDVIQNDNIRDRAIKILKIAG